MTDPKPTPARTNPFWDFSLALYASPQVQKACLDLQDGSGVDVNVLLYMLWHGANQKQLTNEDARSVLAAIEPWRVDVVVPLRTARRNLKQPAAAVDPQGADTLRAIVKKAELDAERLQQSALFALKLQSANTRATAPPRDCAKANAAAYADALGRPLASAPLGVMLDALEAMLAAPRAI